MKPLKLLCAAAAAVTMTFTAQAEKTAKAVVEGAGDNKTLKFVYDDNDYGTKGTDWFSVAEAEAIDPQTDDVPWASYGGRVTKVIFDPSFAGYRPTQCGSWFYGFSSLATIEGIKNLDTSEAANFAYMFDYCLTLTALDLSGFDTAKATDMHFMFADSKNLKTISVSDRFVTTKVADSSNMFRGCTALVGGAGTAYDSTKTDKTYARIDKDGQPGYFTKKEAKAVLADSGKTLKFVYDGKDYGTKDVDWFSVAEAEAINPYSDNVPWFGKRSTVTKVVFDSSFAAYRPKQCGCWFYNFDVLAAVDGLKNLDTSVATSMAYMFCYCESLVSLDVSGFDTSKVTSMYSMFSGCSALTTLDVSGFDTASVTGMAWMFDGCSSLTTLDVSGFDTSKVTDMYGMFSGCSSLASIAASDKFVTTAVTSSGSMFKDCTALKGGNGTAYDAANPTDATYARIDKAGAPGYFTDIADVYKVKFVAGEGTGTMADLICARDKVYNLTKCAFTAPTGKAFKGWAGSNGRRYDDEMLVFDLGDVTMTAIWDIGGVQLWENGPYWAECNVGATKPEEYGYYFWWGDTVGGKRNADDDGWVSVAKGESSSFSSGNCPTYDKTTSELQSAGYIDSTGNLVANYDAATAYLGAPWRMPTDAELGELCSNCTMTWEQQNGVWGRRVTGKGDFASRSIFLPAAGNGYDSNLFNTGSLGGYWSSTPDSDYSIYAWYLCFNSGYFFRDYSYRYGGRSVRPVRGFAK